MCHGGMCFSVICISSNTPRNMCGRSGNQTPLTLWFFRTVRHSLRPNGARYGGTDDIEQTPLIVRTVSSQYNWRYPGFHRFLAVGSRARNPPLVPRLLTRCSANKMHSHSAQEHGRNCICSGEHISPRKHKSCASGSRPLVCNPNRTSDDTRLDFFCCKLKVRGRLDEACLDCTFRKEFIQRGISFRGLLRRTAL